MPVGALPGCERPTQASPRQTGLNLPVFGHVKVVIIVGEITVKHRPINGQSHKHQQQADERRRPEFGCAFQHGRHFTVISQ
jgi:hypothetical protein